MCMIQPDSALDRFMQVITMPGLKVRPGGYRDIVQHAVDDDPCILLQDQVQVFQLRDIHAYAVTQALQGDLDVIVVYGRQFTVPGCIYRYLIESGIHVTCA